MTDNKQTIIAEEPMDVYQYYKGMHNGNKFILLVDNGKATKVYWEGVGYQNKEAEEQIRKFYNKENTNQLKLKF